MTELTKGKGLAAEYYCDEPESGVEAGKLLGLARLKLLAKFPFFGKMACSMPLIEKASTGTTAVDPKGRLYYNPRWVNAFSLDDAIFEFGHEVMHLVQRCSQRSPKGGNHALWNLAADYHCDTSLIDMGFTQSFASKLMVGPAEQALARKYKTIERLYKYLLEKDPHKGKCPGCEAEKNKVKSDSKNEDKAEKAENDKMKGEEDESSDSGDSGEGDGGEDASGASGEGGEGGEGEGSGDGGDSPSHTCGNLRECCAGTTADLSQGTAMDEQKWTELLIASKMHAESRGNMPAAIGEAIDALTKSTVRWQDYIKTAATKIFGRDRYTYKRFNRRMRGMGKLASRLPVAQPDGKSAVGVMDTSGSMSDDEVRQSASEFAEIAKQCGAKKLYLILHDAAVYYAGEVSVDALTELKMSRGGTSHGEVFEILTGGEVTNQHGTFKLPKDLEVELAVLFTDLGTDFTNLRPTFECIWAVPSDGCPGPSCEVPFGKTVVMDMDAIRKSK